MPPRSRASLRNQRPTFAQSRTTRATTCTPMRGNLQALLSIIRDLSSRTSIPHPASHIVGGVDVVVPLCGLRKLVNGYVTSTLSRSLPPRRCRIVIISSKSASNSLTTTRQTTYKRTGIRIRTGPGRNMDVTQGCNARHTTNECIVCISTSSCLSPNILKQLARVVSQRQLSVLYFSVTNISRRNNSLPL